MTTILGRSILRALAATFTLTTGALTLMLCTGLTLRLVMDEGLELAQIAPMVRHLAVRSLTFTVPLGVLTSVILTYGRLCGTREFQAAQWGGVRPAALFWPGMLLGTGAWLFSWMANDFWIPRSQYVFERAVEQSVAELALLKITHGMQDATFRGMPLAGAAAPETEAPLFHLFVRDPRPDGTLNDVTLFEIDSNAGYVARAVYHASRGRIAVANRPRRAQITFDGVESIRLDTSGNVLSHLADPPERAPLRYTFPIPKPVVRVDRRQIDSGRLLGLLADASLPRKEARLLRQEFVERDALAAANLAFAILGIPLGLFSRRGNFFVGLGMAFILVFALYYPSMMLGRALSGSSWTSCAVPLWLPTLTVVGVALWTLRRVLRRQA